MAKSGEIAYLGALGPDGRRHAINKPFSDEACGRYLTRIGVILDLLPPPPLRVLDLGCGTGWTSVFLARCGYEVVGQDIAPDMIDGAREMADREGAGATFVVSDYEALPYREDFGAALFFDSLHHAEDERAALASTHQALRPGGVLVLSEPGAGHGAAPDSQSAMAEFNVTEKDMPPWRTRRLLREVGFRDVAIHPHPQHLLPQFYPLSYWRDRRAGWTRWIPWPLRAVLINTVWKRRCGLVVARRPGEGKR